jgi:hypothetical protein
MTPSSPTPRLPQWIFYVTYAILLVAAWLILNGSARPLSGTAVFAIVACVIGGALIATVPLVIRYERRKNETLDDRQRALEALALTLTAAAEQISIAAQGMHQIAELAQKNLRLAEELPAKLQGKITEFETLLTNAQADEREEMKKELALLRASESDRLEAIADKVDHASAELAKLEAAAQKHLTAAQAALAKAPEALTAATSAALAEIETKLASRPPMPASARESAAQLTAPPFGGHLISVAPAPAAPANPEPASPAPASAPDEPRRSSESEGGPAAPPEPVKKRAPRKPKAEPVAESTPALALDVTTAAAPAAKVEAAKKPGASEFNQTVPDEPAKPAAELGESVISSDRATRLLVTAYIGIGNRLFIRGEGPGLSWDKGVPLQFVSIGKWRWETSDATAPVKFKLYKNDELECTALGSQSLSPEHQQEITAEF